MHRWATLAAAVMAANVEIGSNCFVVVQDGALVHEQYWNDTDADSDTAVFSTTKSVASIIVGIAQDLGFLDIDQPASDFLTEWVGTDSESVTIRSLLQNTSGRYYEFENDFGLLPAAADQSAFAIALDQQAPPDTVWFYNNSAIQTREQVVERATSRDVGEFAREHLFDPLDMTVTMGRDEAGNVGFYAGIEAGCLDMARFMLMVSRGGDWGGRQIVSADYVAEALSPASEIDQAYGLLFWRNADPPWDHTDARRDRTDRFWPDAPLDAYMASGAADQVSMVFPADDTLFVRLGPFGATAGYDGVVANDLAGLMVDALDG